MKDNVVMIYPCPFSKRYGIPEDQAWLLLNIFFIYRFVIAALFCMLYFTQIGPSLLGSTNPGLYLYTSSIYLFLTVIATLGLFWRFPGYPIQAQLFIFTDIVCITLLMHSSGGITSGIGILLAVSTAAGGLLIGGKCALLFAAIASVVVFSEQIYADLALDSNTAYTYSGMLGASFFTIALLSYFLARRTELSERLAQQQKRTISKLEELNHYIIRHLQSGILLVDNAQHISVCNTAALRLLQIDEIPEHLWKAPPQLAVAYENWQVNPLQNSAQLETPNGTQLQAVFYTLPIEGESLDMINLSDMKLYNQRVQQSKLASLGRLTASIAHEVRNPLGAISHAAQLLSENPKLNDQDQRFVEIIQNHSARVNRIIEDILQLSRRKTSDRETLELLPWLQNFLENFIEREQLPENHLQLVAESQSVHILFDPQHLQQIMDNLCLNAFKYGDQHKPVTLQTLYDQTTKQHVLLVIDQGSGISDENQQHLFEPFFTTSSSGSGLGLYISSELAQLNQAKLRYQYVQDKGSCFILDIPDVELPVINL